MKDMPPPDWLERANRLALTARLLSSTVHDVNNALQVIAGSVELLQMTPAANEMVQRRITAIDTQSKRASKLLQDLTEFVRDARSAPETIDLKALAEQVVATRHYAVTKLRITASVAGEPVKVSANPKHVQQIVLNLVVNAEDAQCSTLVIRTGRNGDQAELLVEDSGSRAMDKTARENLGIGLEVSTWLAQKNGGTVTYEPAADGFRAKLSLPAAS